MRRSIVLAFFLAASTGAARTAAQTTTGDLQGTVRSEDAQPLGSALVTLRAPGVRERTILSDARGFFRALALPPAAYQVSVKFIGRDSVTLDNAQVRLGQTTDVGAVVLKPRVVEVGDVIGVGARPLIDPRNATYGAHLTRDAFEFLPQDRDYQSLASILPHANTDLFGSGVNFAGATGLENQFFVEGINVSDPLNGQGGIRLPYNFVKELAVRTGAYAAEYRGALGGIVNVVTASGTNDFAAEAFGFYTGRHFNNAPHFGQEIHQGDYSLYDVGANLSGPVVRDRVWFYAAWNPTFENSDVPLQGLNQVLTDKTVANRYAGKITWQPSPRSRFEFISVGDPVKRDGVGVTYISYGGIGRLGLPDPIMSVVHTGAASFSARATLLPGQKTVLEASIERTAFSEKHQRRDGDSDSTLFIDRTDASGGLWLGGYPENVDLDNSRMSAHGKLTTVMGRHELKAGGEVEQMRTRGREHERFTVHRSDIWRQFEVQASGSVRNRSVGLFIQDAWQVSDQVAINPGLRFGSEWIIGSDDEVAMRLHSEWQPRLSVILQPTRAGKISGAFGRYYQSLHMAAPEYYFMYGSHRYFLDYDHDPRIDPSGGTGDYTLITKRDEVLELNPQGFDEWMLSYEHSINSRMKATVRGIHRALLDAIEDASMPPDENDVATYTIGNPGRGVLTAYPRAVRTYSALELSVERAAGRNAFLTTSYVYSRNFGNYTGLFETDQNYPFPNSAAAFDNPEALRNANGLLPNDRTHVFKLAGWYRIPFAGLTLGSSFLWQSGTPLSEMGPVEKGADVPAFVTQRGSAGRTPARRDFNVRTSWQVPRRLGDATVMVDLFHLFSHEAITSYDQWHYFANEGGVFSDANPGYMSPTGYALPMSARLGMTVKF